LRHFHRRRFIVVPICARESLRNLISWLRPRRRSITRGDFLLSLGLDSGQLDFRKKEDGDERKQASLLRGENEREEIPDFSQLPRRCRQRQMDNVSSINLEIIT
jgi:hypothetical protein